jgi:hypothetical protein
MKANIFIEKVSDSALEAIHGMGYRVTRLHIPEADNLVITVYQGKMYAFKGCTPSKKAESAGTVEVPDTLVTDILKHIEAQKTFERTIKNFWATAIPATMPQ